MISNLLVPPLLFFGLGFFAKLIRSDLEISKEIISFLSVYLMIGIGLQGGAELQHIAWLTSLQAVLAGLAFGLIQPVIAFTVLRWGAVDRCNAAAIAAHYGSVSVGTFLSATAFLALMNMPHEPYPLIMLAIMEAPAIVIGLLLLNANKDADLSWGKVLHKALSNASVLLLIGSMVIGMLSPESGLSAVKPFYSDIFQGMLTLFLVGMGVEAASKLQDFEQAGLFFTAFGTMMPALFGVSGVAIATFILGLTPGGALLVGVLAASASYIAVPSAMRLAVPRSNPSLYLTLSLGITFPFNVLIGIPLYWRVAQVLAGW